MKFIFDKNRNLVNLDHVISIEKDHYFGQRFVVIAYLNNGNAVLFESEDENARNNYFNNLCYEIGVIKI